MKHLDKYSDKIKESILDFIGSETTRFTPVDISTYCKKKFKLHSRETRKLIKELISSGELEYSNDFGRSFLDISFSKPVKISERIYLTPPNIKVNTSVNEICVVIEKGISFGRGTHPTTRLCLQAIDILLKKDVVSKNNSRVLDIGTGSGVLAIAGVLLGINSAHACDIDNIAINEAKNNISYNNLSDKITLSKTFSQEEKYNFIFANLRYPTLINLYETFLKITQSKSLLFLSGIKTEEKEKIINKFQGKSFEKIYEKEESGWMSVVYKRKSK